MQPYIIKDSIRMQWHRSGLIASWEFYQEHTEKRWGVMVIIKSLQLLTSATNTALKETSCFVDSGIGITNGLPPYAGKGNMIHVALIGINNQMSTLQDRYTSL